MGVTILIYLILINLNMLILINDIIISAYAIFTIFSYFLHAFRLYFSN